MDGGGNIGSPRRGLEGACWGPVARFRAGLRHARGDYGGRRRTGNYLPITQPKQQEEVVAGRLVGAYSREART